MCALRLPFPPSSNMLFRSAQMGRKKTAKYKEWIREAGFILMQQRPHKHQGPISISIIVCPPDKRLRDLDNLLKAPLDLLVRHGVIEDDNSQFLKSLTISLGGDEPGLDVTVTAV